MFQKSLRTGSGVRRMLVARDWTEFNQAKEALRAEKPVLHQDITDPKDANKTMEEMQRVKNLSRKKGL